MQEKKKTIQLNEKIITKVNSEEKLEVINSPLIINDTNTNSIEAASYKKVEEPKSLSSNRTSKKAPSLKNNTKTYSNSHLINMDSEKLVKVDIIQLEELNTEQLISAVKDKLDSAPIQSIKSFIDNAKKIFYERSNQTYKEELEKFQVIQNTKISKNEGDDTVEFDYIFPFTSEFKAVLNTYKILRDTFYSEQENNMKHNLEVKLGLIEELKGLLNAEEKMKETFIHFKDIQQRWKTAGQVPKLELNNLWNTYNHHVENFFDYLRINNDLRDIEFKRNLVQKTELCLMTEALDREENLETAFSSLQTLHEKWKEIGPVGKSNREEIWERFQTATKIIHKKRNDFYERRKEEFEIHFEQKISLCKELENIDFSDFLHHNAWQKVSIYVNQMREDWKKIGSVSRVQNDISWTRFTAAIKIFNLKKNEYYKQLKKNKNQSLQAKIKLVEQAESLSNSTEWKSTASTLKKLQNDWKNSGVAPRKESDALWNRLKTSCNIFFENLKKQNEILDKEYQINLEKKENILKTLAKFKNTDKPEKDLDYIKNLISEWKEIGKVPRKNIKLIENSFRKSIDVFFKVLDINKSEKRDFQFKFKIQSIVADGNETKLNDELFKIQQSLKKCKNELSLLENNISFFKHAKEDNPMVVDVRKNIENQKDKLVELTFQMAFIKSL